MTVAYLSGPMRGIKHFNFPLFYYVQAWLEFRGWSVISPAQRDAEEEGLGWRPDETMEITPQMMYRWMRRDLADVCSADAIVLLPGWKDSTGAKAEAEVARLCGCEAYEVTGNREITPIDLDGYQAHAALSDL